MPNNPEKINAKTATAAATSTRQASLDTFTTTKRNKESSDQNLDPRIDDLFKKVDQVLSLVSAAKQVNAKSDIIVPDIVPGNEALSLLEFLSAGNDLCLVENDNERILRCKACTEYLNAPAVQKKKSESACLPSGSSRGCLSFGLCLEEEEYTSCCWKKCKVVLLEENAVGPSQWKREQDPSRCHSLSPFTFTIC